MGKLQHFGFTMVCPCSKFKERVLYPLEKYHRIRDNMGPDDETLNGMPGTIHVRKGLWFQQMSCKAGKEGCDCTQRWLWEDLRYWLRNYNHYKFLQTSACDCEDVEIVWQTCCQEETHSANQDEEVVERLEEWPNVTMKGPIDYFVIFLAVVIPSIFRLFAVYEFTIPM